MNGDVPELKGKKVGVKWYNPITGTYTEAGTRHFENGTWIGIQRPDTLKSSIAVLILEVIE